MGTAVVTGASSGIGEQFARQLAARGHDVVLVARREDRLRAIADELPTKAHVVTCDLAGEAGSLKERVDALGVDVHLLVSNAGFGTYGRFLDQDPARDAEQVRVNCEAVVTLAHDFLPAMVERGRGGMIVVASTAGFQPLPYEPVYSATKAFARTFTDALWAELRHTGVKLLTVNPGPVPTEWQQVSGRPLDIGGVPGKISPEQVARESLRAYDRGKRTLVPGRTIRWYLRLTGAAPKGVSLRVAERMFRPKL